MPEGLLDAVYLALDDPREWLHLLEKLCLWLPADEASLAVSDLVHSEFSFVEAWGITHADLLEYTTKWRDPWTAVVDPAAVRDGDVRASHELVPDEELESMDVYQGFLAPRKLHYGAAIVIEKSKRREVFLSFLRKKELGPAGEREKGILTSIAPHVRRVLRVHADLYTARALSHASLEAFERMNAGLAVLARDGRILFHNRIWRESLNGEEFVAVQDGILRLSSSASQKKLTKLLSPINHAPAQCSIAIPSAKSEVGKRLLLMPVGALPDAPAVIGAPAVVAILLDPERTPALDEGVAREWFGLTPGESAVATRLLRSESIADIAGSLGISQHTVRTHMKSIFAKTGTSRQSALMSMLLRLCASSRADSRSTDSTIRR